MFLMNAACLEHILHIQGTLNMLILINYVAAYLDYFSAKFGEIGVKCFNEGHPTSYFQNKNVVKSP